MIPEQVLNDPQVGDRIIRGKFCRVVSGRTWDFGGVRYVNQYGEIGECDLVTWSRWCRGWGAKYDTRKNPK